MALLCCYPAFMSPRIMSESTIMAKRPRQMVWREPLGLALSHMVGGLLAKERKFRYSVPDFNPRRIRRRFVETRQNGWTTAVTNPAHRMSVEFVPQGPEFCCTATGNPGRTVGGTVFEMWSGVLGRLE